MRPRTRYNSDMQSATTSDSNSAATVTALGPAELVELVGKQSREIVHLRRQVAWFQRQIFGQKSEKRLPQPDGVQGTLGEAFDAVPDDGPPNKKTPVAGHERASRPRQPTADADEAALFFDDQKVPVKVINMPNPEIAGLGADEFEVIGEKVSHRLAQRPGSYVILKYVRTVVKRRDTQVLSCPAAPVGVIDGSRADVSFIVGMMVDKFAFHMPLYRQHQRLRDAGINVCRPWLTQLMQAAVSLLEPIHDAQLESIRASRVKAMDESVSRTGGNPGCCAEDGSRPPEVGLQEQASNRSVLLHSKGVVVSDRVKVVRQGRQVRFEKMSESKPSDEASSITKVLSKPRTFHLLGIGWGVTCLRTQRQPALRRHELETGFGMERENLVLDEKGNDKW